MLSFHPRSKIDVISLQVINGAQFITLLGCLHQYSYLMYYGYEVTCVAYYVTAFAKWYIPRAKMILKKW